MPRLTARTVLWGAATALVAAAVGFYVASDRLPELTTQAVEQAQATWRAAAPADYDLTLMIAGTELDPGTYAIETRGGEVVSASRDGIALTGSADAYSIDGLHKLLLQELDLAANPTRSYGAPAGYRAYLFARFDERGLPVRFRRVVGGTSRYVEWRIEALTSPP